MFLIISKIPFQLLLFDRSYSRVNIYAVAMKILEKFGCGIDDVVTVPYWSAIEDVVVAIVATREWR